MATVTTMRLKCVAVAGPPAVRGFLLSTCRHSTGLPRGMRGCLRVLSTTGTASTVRVGVGDAATDASANARPSSNNPSARHGTVRTTEERHASLASLGKRARVASATLHPEIPVETGAIQTPGTPTVVPPSTTTTTTTATSSATTLTATRTRPDAPVSPDSAATSSIGSNQHDTHNTEHVREVGLIVSEVSRYLFEESGGLLSDDLGKLCGSTRSSLRRRGWSAFLARTSLAAAAGRCGSAVIRDADTVSKEALTSGEIGTVDHEIGKVEGWSASASFIAHLCEMAALEGRHEFLPALTLRMNASLDDKVGGRAHNSPLRGETALQRAMVEAESTAGPCIALNAARARHIFRLTRRGEQGWRAADALFASLRSKGLASWELVATLLPTIPSLADQEAFVSEVSIESCMLW